jgi:hypothetical protein
LVERYEKNRIELEKIKILSDKYMKNRNSFWKEIDSRKCRSPEINIEYDELLRHYIDLFGTEIKNPNNKRYSRPNLPLCFKSKRKKNFNDKR